MRRLSFCLLLLSSCALPPATPQSYLQGQNLPPATPESFPHCYNYGCDHVKMVSFHAADWTVFKTLFTPASVDGAQERKRIGKAVGMFERIVGERTGTKNDIYGTFRHVGTFQHDCIDESTNTTIYLSLLEQRGYLHFHNVSAPDTRLPLFHGGHWPHRTAVVIEKQNETAWAVDSWFHDNGFDAEIVPLKRWKEGWKPAAPMQKGSDFSAAP